MNPIENISEFRIRYSHTDQMGIVYYGNYALLYEIGRTELMRDLGLAYSELEKSGIIMPVVEMQSKYIRPLIYDDLVCIKTILSEPPTATIVFEHAIFNSRGELCNKGMVKLGFLNRNTGKPIRVPSILAELIQKFEK